MIRKLYNKLFGSTLIPFRNVEERIIEAFEVGGVKYYQFDNDDHLPHERAFDALTFYQELEMRCTRDFLVKHTEAVDAIISDPQKINIGQLAILNRQLQERLKWIIEPDIGYKLASVLFFDKTESPFSYDFKYGQKKIEFWKKHKKVGDFFLQLRLKELNPFSENSDMNLEIYSKMVESLNRVHWDNISTSLSRFQKKTG